MEKPSSSEKPTLPFSINDQNENKFIPFAVAIVAFVLAEKFPLTWSFSTRLGNEITHFIFAAGIGGIVWLFVFGVLKVFDHANKAGNINTVFKIMLLVLGVLTFIVVPGIALFFYGMKTPLLP